MHDAGRRRCTLDLVGGQCCRQGANVDVSVGRRPAWHTGPLLFGVNLCLPFFDLRDRRLDLRDLRVGGCDELADFGALGGPLEHRGAPAGPPLA